MYSVSQGFLDAIKEPFRHLKADVKIRDKTFNDEDIIEMNLEESVNPADTFMLGGVASSKFSITLMNVPKELILEGASIEPRVATLVGEQYEFVPLGKFTVDEINKDKDIVKLSGFDNMIKLEKAYFSNLVYPTSINAVALEICSKASVELANPLPNINVGKLEGYTLREAISFIASFMGGFARFNRVGKLEIVSYATSNVEITPANYFKFTTSENSFTIGKLACQVGDKILYAGTNGNEIQFENPLMTQAQLTSIYNNLRTQYYMPYSIEWQGNPALMAGDKVNIKDLKGSSFDTFVMQQTLRYSGGLKATSKAVGKTEQAQEFDTGGSMSKKVDRVVVEQININKALIDKATIEDLTATKAKIEVLEVQNGTINNLLAGNLTAANIKTGAITAGIGIIADGAIGNAQISDLSATKVKTGTLDTALVNIQGKGGNLSIINNRLQVVDKGKERVVLGDVNADGTVFGLRVRGEDGVTLLLDENGVKKEGITNGAIDNSKVADNANISGSKLNIDDVIVNINTSTTQINGTKIQVGDRTLDAELSTQKILINGNTETISNQASSINALDNAIKLKVDNQTYTADLEGVNTKLNKNTANIDLMQNAIELKVSQTDVNNTISNIKLGGTNIYPRPTEELVSTRFLEITTAEIFKNHVGKSITISFDMKCEIARPINIYPYQNNGISIEGLRSVKVAEVNKYERFTFNTIIKDWGINNETWTKGSIAFYETIGIQNYSIKNIEFLVDKVPFTEKITQIDTQVAGININLGNVTTRVGNAEQKTTELDGKIVNIDTMVQLAEQKITPTAIMNTINTSINNGTGAINTTSTVLDKDGFTIKNGALKIKNKADRVVLEGDVNGNLQISGAFKNKGENGLDAIKIENQAINFYDWEKQGIEIGMLETVFDTVTKNRGLNLWHTWDGSIDIGYKSADGAQITSYVAFDKFRKRDQYFSPIEVSENTVFDKEVFVKDKLFAPHVIYLGGGIYDSTPMVYGSSGQMILQIPSDIKENGLQIQRKNGDVSFGIYAGNDYIVQSFHSTKVNGNFTVTGSKNSLQTTEHYGDRLINAYETMEYFHGDIGEGIINQQGECLVDIDEIVQECINLKCTFHVFTQVYKGKITEIDRHENYFVVYGDPNTTFSWELKAKRIGYENCRHDVVDIGTIENKTEYTDEDLKNSTSEKALDEILDFNLENILI